MLWALLALLGVPIWLILGVLGGAYWNRRRFKQVPGVFRLKYKEALSEKWPRQATYGRWIHDVLLINIRNWLGATNGRWCEIANGSIKI